jgi:hypothetical protein
VQLTRERVRGNKKAVKIDLNTMANLTGLLQGICDYKIQTFFSFETCEETSFSALATKGVSDYIDKTKVLLRKEYSDYAIPCLPNMSIVPKNKSGVILDTLMVVSETGAGLSQDSKDELKLFLKGIYIPACYVGAGLIAACQCPDFLKSRGFGNVSKDFPGVRFDIEASDNALRTPTTLAKEISGYTSSVKDDINKENFGFLFSSDNYQIKTGKDIRDVRQITVYKARSMKTTESGMYESIYMALTTTYIERILRAVTSDNKQDNVIKFFSANPESQKSVWFSKAGFVNSVMTPNDELSYSINGDYCELNLSFGGNTKNLEIVLNKNAKIS